MDDRLVTILRCDSPIEANLAKNRLEAAGLRAFLQGEEVIGMVGYLSNATGGIQLQVAADDVAQAEAILTSAPEAESAGDYDPETTLRSEESSDEWRGDADATEPEPTEREKNGERAFRGAVLGILFIPLQVYVGWLLFKVLLSEEELRGRYRFKTWMAATISGPYILGLCFLLGMLLNSRPD